MHPSQSAAMDPTSELRDQETEIQPQMETAGRGGCWAGISRDTC